MLVIRQKQPTVHRQSVNGEHIKSSYANSKNSILDVKSLSNVDMSSAKVHITEVIIKGLPRGDISRKVSFLFKSLFM